MLAWLLHFFCLSNFLSIIFASLPLLLESENILLMQYNQEVKIFWTKLKVECQLLEGPLAKKKGMWHKLEDLWHQEAPPVFPSRKLDLAWGVEEFVKLVEGISTILLIIEGCPDRLILRFTVKPYILLKNLFHWIYSIFYKDKHGHDFFWPQRSWRLLEDKNTHPRPNISQRSLFIEKSI